MIMMSYVLPGYKPIPVSHRLGTRANVDDVIMGSLSSVIMPKRGDLNSENTGINEQKNTRDEFIRWSVYTTMVCL